MATAKTGGSGGTFHERQIMSIFECAELANSAAGRWGGCAGVMHLIPQDKRMAAMEISVRAAIIQRRAKNDNKSC